MSGVDLPALLCSRTPQPDCEQQCVLGLGSREKREKGQLAQKSVSLLSPSLPSVCHDKKNLYLLPAMDRSCEHSEPSFFLS